MIAVEKVEEAERSEGYILKESGITLLIFNICGVIHFQNRTPTLQESKCLCQEVKSYDQPFIGSTNMHHSFCRLLHCSSLRKIFYFVSSGL